MSKAQRIEDAQEFVDDYENIIDTLNGLVDDLQNKALKQEIFDLIGVVEEDFKEEKEEREKILLEAEEEEERYMNREYESSRY